jgi:hypothetical protein
MHALSHPLRASLYKKPLALDAGECLEMDAAARQRGVTLMEAFMYRFHPRTQKSPGPIAGGCHRRAAHDPQRLHISPDAPRQYPLKRRAGQRPICASLEPSIAPPRMTDGPQQFNPDQR